MGIKSIGEELMLMVRIRDVKVCTNRKIHKPEIFNLDLLACVDHEQPSESLWGFYSFEIVCRIVCTSGRNLATFLLSLLFFPSEKELLT